MTIAAEYLGMPLEISGLDQENLAYFQHCSTHRFHLQQCVGCKLVRYPPTTACPWCACADSIWVPIEGRGAVHSYTEVHHAIQPAFRKHVPYLVLLVELDTQRGIPTTDEAIRVIGNLVTAGGHLAGPEEVKRVGIGSRVRMVFTDIVPNLALPQWTIDDQSQDRPWRYPEE